MGGAPNADKPPTPAVAEPQEDDHTDLQGNVDHDALVRARLAQGIYPQPQTSEKQAVFLLGGAGSGKAAIARSYTGHGKPGDKDYQAPRPGFSPESLISSDAEKRHIPIYTDRADERGGYGPSGPKTLEELRTYPPDQQDAMADYLRGASGGKYKSAAHFARDVMPEHNEGGTMGENFGGGLTHELSSYVAKQKLLDAIRSNKPGAFVYHSTGSEDYPEMAKAAADNGYSVHLHHVDTHPEVAQMRNAESARSVDPAIVESTHAKVERILPTLRAFQKAAQADGQPVYWDHTRTSNDSDLAKATEKGYARHGKM